jgi:hypothetical protein
MGASYTGPVFFGGFTAFRQSTAAANGTTDAFIIQNNGTTDDLRAVVRNATGHFVFLFQTSEPVKFVTGDSISQKTQQLNSSSGRIVVQSGGQFYLSQNSLAAADTTINFDPSAALWSLYNIAAGTNDFIPDSLVFDVPGTSLNNISHVGIYVLASEASGSVLELQNLQVNATPVPEPSVLMACSLLAIGMAGHALWRRTTQGNL